MRIADFRRLAYLLLVAALLGREMCIRDSTCDVCICGAGNSGLSAAVEAAQQGLGVVVLEKHGGTGGGGIGTEGVFAVNSKMQQDAGIAIEPAEVIATEMSYSHNRANGLKWLDLIEASGENISCCLLYTSRCV